MTEKRYAAPLTVHEDFLHRQACQKLLEKNHRHCQGTATTEGETCNSADRLGPDSCHPESGSQGSAVFFPATFWLGKKAFLAPAVLAAAHSY